MKLLLKLVVLNLLTLPIALGLRDHAQGRAEAMMERISHPDGTFRAPRLGADHGAHRAA